MKKIIVLFLLALTTVAACKKETKEKQSPEGKSTQLPEKLQPCLLHPNMAGETFADVGGYKLHYKAMGTGTGKPTVVFESGLDWTGMSSWLYKVQPEVAKFASTISYDRAGIFMSERGNKPKTGENMATDLYTLLKKTGHPGPYILVGHSMAGLTLRSFVDKYANEVAGVVFVDASHPLQWKRLKTDPILNKPDPSPRPPNESLTVDPSIMMTPEVINLVARAQAFAPTSMPVASEEEGALESICAQAEHLKKFGNTPLTVITGTNRAESSFDAQYNAADMNWWMTHQKEHLTLSTKSKHILATKSGHFVQLDEPQLVIDAVRELTNKL